MKQAELPGLVSTDSAARVDQWLRQATLLLPNDPSAALTLCDAARGMAARLDEQHRLAQALMRGALCQARLAEERSSSTLVPEVAGDGVDWLNQARTIFHGLQDHRGEAQACNHLANLYARRSDHDQALQLYHRSLALRRSMGDRVGEAGLLNNIGLVLRETAQYADALACLVEALEQGEAMGAPGIVAHALASIGSVLADLDEGARASEYLLRALSLLEERPDPGLETTVCISLGRLLALAGQAQSAQHHLERALRLAQHTGEVADLANALLAQGMAARRAGDGARAEWLLQEALSASRRTANRMAQAEAMLALGQLRIEADPQGAGIELLQQALTLVEPLKADALCAQIHEVLSCWHEGQGRYEQALGHFKAFHACRQRVHGQGVQRRLRKLLTRADLERANRLAEEERRRGQELEIALDVAREADRQKEELLATLSRQTEALQQLAREDGLTGVANRRWLDAQLARERERARRHGHPLSVAMVDIDHFKSINDQCSHAVGDEVLRRVAALLQQACRSGDVVGRYGGEEFTVVLVETPLQAAQGVCEKLRLLVEQQAWSELHPALHRVTVSIGLAGDVEDPVNTDLAGLADQALYRAKRQGRNRVCLSD